MSQRMLDRGQLVGYDLEVKTLIVTIGEKIAEKMKADGWNVGYEKEVGHFISVRLEEDAT